MFPFLYFDLAKQKLDIEDGVTKMTFKYAKPSGSTAKAYSVYNNNTIIILEFTQRHFRELNGALQ